MGFKKLLDAEFDPPLNFWKNKKRRAIGLK
jgi:hypothetical protein